ncbi:hypothetical protein [Salinarimonas soli]|uniref:Uncharacterized protein n=1 Tax=Salinarimonas soli TaxID=1638099 RepID=A0A5B2VH25_9HYPH|nr:hypothetical protein [Salinarimonas soli]KAA2237477.1 hypothetical protein F0L46_10815 [Salinarimonas soli]
MSVFLAVVLVCATATPVEACDDTTALEIRTVKVENELGCTMGWQEIMARATGDTPAEEGTYLKTACRRVRSPAL